MGPKATGKHSVPTYGQGKDVFAQKHARHPGAGALFFGRC